jgi:hypothetical protein
MKASELEKHFDAGGDVSTFPAPLGWATRPM